jgi:glycopeptide antibiotics resistance protein
MMLARLVTVSPGRIADIDDLIGNTVGTLFGYAKPSGCW